MPLSATTIALILATENVPIELQAELTEALIDLVGENAPHYFSRACQIVNEVREIIAVG